MHTGQPLIFNKGAWTSFVLSLSCALGGCDKVTYAEVAIELASAVEPACIEGAAQSLGATERFTRVSERPGAIEFSVQRGDGRVNIVAAEEPAQIRMAFGWLGKESDEVELASLRLLEDVHAAVMQSCKIQAPPAKISTRCGTRHCDGWMKTVK